MDLRLVIVLCLSFCCDAYKVLLINPLPLRSLNILGVGYVKNLLAAGHEVTYLTADPIKNPPEKNYRQINMSTHYDLFKGDKFFDISYIMQNPLNEDADIDYLQGMGMVCATATFKLTEVRKMLEDPKERFDVVITDFFESEMYAVLGAYYDCPMIWAYSLGAHWTTEKLINEPTSAAYALDYLTPDIPPHHSVSTRVKKLWARTKWWLNKWYKTKPLEKAFYEEYFTPLFQKKNKPLPNYDEVIYSASMVLANDFPGNGPMPSLPQNYKFVGGYHVEVPTKPLPEELQKIADNSKHGFIYFSMGSIWKSKDMPDSVKKGLLDIFSGLKETVIWKFEENLPNLPKNVHIVQWAPQQSILAHPKCLFFISHGGLLSTLESIHFGVPTIGIPVYYDQFINVNRAVLAGRTIKVDLTMNLVEDIRNAVHKMLSDPSYKENALKLTQIYHGRPVPPAKELVHWVEHVVKTEGARHLRSPAAVMSWWEKWFIDVIALHLILILSIFFMVRQGFRNYSYARDSHKKNN